MFGKEKAAMKRGERVRVKQTVMETWCRGRTGTVVVDSVPGELVEVELNDEVITHSFLPEELEADVDAVVEAALDDNRKIFPGRDHRG